MPRQDPNPIETRVARLKSQYEGFAAAPDARLLHWVIDADERSFLDTFLRMEQDEDAGDCPELLLRFDVPFEHPEAYGFALRADLCRQYDLARPSLEEAGLPADWACPAAGRGESGIAAFLAACGAFRAHHASWFEQLMLVLTPVEVSDGGAWEAWLREVLQLLTGPEVRLIVPDRKEQLMLGSLASQRAHVVQTVVADLDVAAAIQEVSDDAADQEAEGGRFRRLFLAMTQQLERGDLSAAQTKGTAAIELARQAGWPYLVATVHYALGGGYLGASNPTEAIRCYQAAEHAATEAHEAGEPSGLPFRVKARLAIGTAMVVAKTFDRAAPYFVETVPLAEQADDRHMQLESWRMASHCYENSRQPAGAWEAGIKALEVGVAMDEETRRSSSLPYVGEALLRLTKQPAYSHYARGIEQQMVQLLGQNWRPTGPTPLPQPQPQPADTSTSETGGNQVH